VPLVAEEDEQSGFPHWRVVASTPNDILDRARDLTTETKLAERRARAAAEARDAERKAVGLQPLAEWRHKEWKGRAATFKDEIIERGPATTFDATRSGDSEAFFNPLGLEGDGEFDAFDVENCSENADWDQ
jgi:hypothetical protein